MEFDAVLRIDTPGEADYYRNGGILRYVLRRMALRAPCVAIRSIIVTKQ